MAQLFTLVGAQGFLGTGAIAPGAVLEFFEDGTTTPYTVYSDDGLTSAHGTTVTADSEGRFAAIFWANATAIKYILKDADGNVLQTVEGVTGLSVEATGASQISFTPTAEISDTNVQGAIESAALLLGVTPADTAPDTLNNKVSVTAPVVKTVGNAGNDETFTLSLDLATEAEAEAGTSNVKAMTPLRAKQGRQWQLVSEQSPTSGTEVEWTDLSAYSELRLVFFQLTWSSAGNAGIVLSADNGTTYDTTSGDYYAVAAEDNTGTNTTDEMRLHDNTTTSLSVGVMEFMSFNNASEKTFMHGSIGIYQANGYRTTAEANDALKIVIDTGAFSSGSVALFGR